MAVPPVVAVSGTVNDMNAAGPGASLEGATRVESCLRGTDGEGSGEWPAGGCGQGGQCWPWRSGTQRS